MRATIKNKGSYILRHPSVYEKNKMGRSKARGGGVGTLREMEFGHQTVSL